MTDPKPIPLAEFTAALQAHDRAEFASFVGDLRAVRVDDAQALCERTLGMPAYSTRYASTPPTPETTPRDPPQGESATRRAGRPVLLAGLLVLVVLAAGAGGVYVTGAGDPIAALLGTEDPATDETPSSAESLEEGGDFANVTAAPTTSDGEETGQIDTDSEATRQTASGSTSRRNVGLEPTCNRSYLHVVQIQMNALKHNNESTNDGIRTVRQFASPANRRAVGSVRDYPLGRDSLKPCSHRTPV